MRGLIAKLGFTVFLLASLTVSPIDTISNILKRINSTYSTERLYETNDNAKGTEFLLQNTLGYANKSDVNAKQELEVTEKQRIKQLPDEEVEGRLQRLASKIVAITSKKKAE